MKNIFDTVAELLLTNDKYKAEDGKLLKAVVYSDVMAMSKDLLTLLLSNEDVKETFFKDVQGTLVFDKQKFAWFMESKEFLPDSYTAYTNKIGLTHNGSFISQTNDVVLDFPYKDCVLEGGQDKDDQKRSEIFYNETIASDEISRMIAPKVFTNAKRYTAAGSKDLLGNLDPDTIHVEEKTGITFSDNDNLIIKGNNLIALASLLKRYEGKVKCIYIDPPYNTGNDSFNYNDSFNHSTWLTFMKNRLELAKRLLREDGSIFVQCDDNEQAYLKVLMDGIFISENFVNCITVKMSTPSGLKMSHVNKKILKTKEYILVYAKNKELLHLNPQYIEKSNYDWEYSHYIEKNNSTDINDWTIRDLRDVLLEQGIIKSKNESIIMSDQNFKNFYLNNADLIWARGRHHNIPKNILHSSKEDKDTVFSYNNGQELQYAYRGRRMAFLNKTIKVCLTKNGTFTKDIAMTICDFWNFINTGKLFAEGDVEFTNAKKPELLVRTIIAMVTNPSDLVLDFHLGSGTTAAVAHKMGRRYIGVEQMDYIQDITVERLKKVLEGEQGGISKSQNWHGGGSFVYCELKEDANTLINTIQNATEDTIESVKASIYADERIVPYLTKQELADVDKDFENLTLEEKKQALTKLIDKNKLYVNASDMDDESYQISDADKAFTKSFYEEA